jgi:Lrp/AsnC family transcriptional regulator
MLTTDLDNADLRILKALQEDASRSIADIAADINLSQNACWRRIKRLEEERFIIKRVALLDAEKLGAGVTVFMMIGAAEHSRQWLGKFADTVRQIPEVMEFYRMSGTIDYLLKVKVADVAAYDRVYQRLIHSIELRDVSSAFAMEQIKHTSEIPLPTKDRR